MYEIIQKFITQNRSGKALNSVGAVVHETATPGATINNEWTYFNNAYRSASAHAFVDWNGIMQFIPWDEVSWGSGPTSNNRFWQIELCRPTGNDPSKFKEVWDRGVWLYAYLFTQVANPRITTVTNENLMSHDEVSRKWHETTHTDPVQYFAEYGLTVDDFRNAVQTQINQMLGGKQVKYLVAYGKKEDKPAAEILAYKIGCPVMNADIPFDYSVVENVLCVGAPGKLPFTGYAKEIIAGKDQEDTIRKVLDFKIA